MTGEIVQIQTRPYEVDRRAYVAVIWKRRFFAGLVPLLIIGAITDALIAIGANQATIVALVAATLLTIAILYPARRYFSARRMASSPKNRAMFSARTIFLSDVDIYTVHSDGGESRIPWTSIQFAERRKNFSLLFISTLLCLPIPDDAFLTEADRERFFALVSRHVKWKGKNPQLG